MTKITKNIMTKKQALALVGKDEARKKILESDKEYFTDEEVDELRGFEWFPRYPVVGNNPSKRSNHGGEIAEDDLIHSYDNNYEEWR